MRLTPRYFFFQFTSLCNSRCITCHLWAKEPVERIPVEQVERLSRFIDPIHVGSIFLTGGEPLFDPTCVDVAAALNRFKPGVRMVSATNGICPELYLDRVRWMQAAGVAIRFAVSINGEPETHDKSRGTPGNYQKAVETARGLKALGALASINILPIPGLTTPADWQHVRILAADLGVPAWSSPILRHNPWFGDEDDGATIPPFDCCGGRDALAVLFNGNITACQEPRPELVFANLRDEGLDWQRALRIQRYIADRGCQPCGCCTNCFTEGVFVA